MTADDDIYYPRNWLEQLLELHEQRPDHIVAHRAHRIKFKDRGLAPYREWDQGVADAPALFPTGGGGVLYPPGSLHGDVTNRNLFQKLCPKADDVWFWAMAVLNDTQYAVVPNGCRRVNLIDRNNKSGGTCLRLENCGGGGNDRQLRTVIAHYPKLQEWLKRYCDRMNVEMNLSVNKTELHKVNQHLENIS